MSACFFLFYEIPEGEAGRHNRRMEGCRCFSNSSSTGIKETLSAVASLRTFILQKESITRNLSQMEIYIKEEMLYIFLYINI